MNDYPNFTTHGHAVHGVTQPGDTPPPNRARCDGPGLCKMCSREAIVMQGAHRPKDERSDDDKTPDEIRAQTMREIAKRIQTGTDVVKDLYERGHVYSKSSLAYEAVVGHRDGIVEMLYSDANVLENITKTGIKE